MTDIIQGFAGFTAGKTRFTPIPNQVFSDLLPIVDDLDELKAIFYTFWRLAQGEGDTRYLRLPDVLSDLIFLDGMGDTPEEREERTRRAFTRATQRGVLIEVEVKRREQSELWYFLNSAKGRQSVEQLRRGHFEHLMHDIDDVVVGLEKERSNIFLLYEQNIGMITPMLAERLRQAERIYPEDWLRAAFEQAVARNARNWAYIEKILQRWAQDGKDTTPQTGRTTLADTLRDESHEDDDEPFILQ